MSRLIFMGEVEGACRPGPISREMERKMMKLSNLFQIFSKTRDAGQGPRKVGKTISTAAVQAVFQDCCDFVCRPVTTGGGEKATLVFLDGMVSGAAVAEQVLRPLTNEARFAEVKNGKKTVEHMLSGSVYGPSIYRRDDLNDVLTDLLNGWCAVIFDSCATAVTLEVKSENKRGIDAPKEEKVVKGAKDAFIEDVRTNTSLVRRKLRNHDLKIRAVTLGTESGTQVNVVYIHGLTNETLVAEVLRRLGCVYVDGVLAPADLEEALVDNPATPFPQMIHTERPDKFAFNILEGRVGLLVDGLPFGYLVPGTFSQFMKAPEDLGDHFLVASVLTVLRYVGMLLTLFLPGFFIAMAMYHQEMIPIKLLQSMIDAKQAVPFSMAVEVIGMLLAFELLQEAGLRLPSPVGDTVSIIGALIVGQSAVEAKVVSPVVVIVIATAGIAGYTMPNQDMGAALRICRFLLALAALIAGVFGLMLGVVLLLYHLCALESYGVPYMTPFAASKRGLFQALARPPVSKKSRREPALKTGRR